MDDKVSTADVFAYAARTNETAAYYMLRAHGIDNFSESKERYYELMNYLEARINKREKAYANS